MEEKKDSSDIQEIDIENENSSQSSIHLCCNQECNATENVNLIAPDFVLNFFNITSKNLHYVCNNCFETALRLQEHLVWAFQNDLPLTSIDTPNYTEVNDLTNDKENIEDLNEPLRPESIQTINDHLQEIVGSLFSRFNLDTILQQEQEILNQRLIYLENESVSLSNQLSNTQKKLDSLQGMARNLCPYEQVNLPPYDVAENGITLNKSLALELGIIPKVLQTTPMPETSRKRTFASHPGVDGPDFVVDKILNNNITQANLPPTGTFQKPLLKKGDIIFTMRLPVFGNWVKGIILEIYPKGTELPTRTIALTTVYKVKVENAFKKNVKLVTGKEIAYTKPSPVRLTYGIRVIALFKDLDLNKNFFYSGTTAEPPKLMNGYRYLVFFDDGYAQYVAHENILPIVEPSTLVWEDTHPDSKEFIKRYLEQYPERPMVKLQKDQVIKTEWNGKWWIARVVEVDCSLAKMIFDADSRTEWIYRGSTRLGPLYSELNHAASRQDQTRTFPRHRGFGLRKQNMPYIEYTRDDARGNEPSAPEEYRVSETSRAVAKKSVTKNKFTSSKFPNQTNRILDPGRIKTVELDKKYRPKIFKDHNCSPECIKHIDVDSKDLRGLNPLSFPLNLGYDRLIAKTKGRRIVMYRGPCGRILRNIKEIHHYLRLVGSKLSVDYFDFDHWVNCTDEFMVDHCLFETPDLSYGSEYVPVQCVNVMDTNFPEYLYYSTQRRPTKGVNLNLDGDFLVGCDCTDDCQDKQKCSCWQLTLQGANYMKGDNTDVHVGYHYRRLAEPVLTGIYECNSRCKCSSTCLNRVAQQPLQMKLQVFKTSSKGWGIRSLNDIPQGAFICIYAGKLLTEEEANKVNISGQDFGDEYLAELDYIEVVERLKEGYESDVEEQNEKRLKNTTNKIKKRKPREPKRSTREFFGEDEYCYIMDAKTHGNIGRYLNHSCSPNVFVQNVFVDTHDLRFPWVAFFASYYIKAGSELTWDYNYDIGSVPGKVLYCHCGSTECRGRLL